MLTRGLVALAVLATLAPPSEACGDKLLVIGRRVKRVPQAKHPATLLLYLRPGSTLSAAAHQMKLANTLAQAGHTVDAVERAEQLHQRLASGQYDFVLIDPSDAASVTLETDAAPGAPGVVPVANGTSAAALARSRGKYPLVIEVGRSRSYLSALDNAMRDRSKDDWAH